MLNWFSLKDEFTSSTVISIIRTLIGCFDLSYLVGCDTVPHDEFPILWGADAQSEGVIWNVESKIKHQFKSYLEQKK